MQNSLPNEFYYEHMMFFGVIEILIGLTFVWIMLSLVTIQIPEWIVYSHHGTRG